MKQKVRLEKTSNTEYSYIFTKWSGFMVHKLKFVILFKRRGKFISNLLHFISFKRSLP